MDYDKKFPRDCNGCENLISYDMSVDDYNNICKVNNMQMDDCDARRHFYWCPLNKSENKGEMKK